jgi:predicted transposase/invertase (TIGR01784 family)
MDEIPLNPHEMQMPQISPLLPPHYDVVFKNIFGPAQLPVLTDFISAVLEPPPEEFPEQYQDIVISDHHLLPNHIKGKLGIPDLRIKTQSGQVITVELQAFSRPSIWKRMEYNTSGLVYNEAAAGEDYGVVNPVITILIYYPILFKGHKEFHHDFYRCSKRSNLWFPDSSVIHVLEVKKAKDTKEDSALANWLRFFAAETEEEFDMVAQTRAAIAKAWEVVKLLSQDEQARYEAQLEEIARMDVAVRRRCAIIEGRQEREIEIARNLLLAKIPEDEISKATGLSLDEVNKLAEELKERLAAEPK